MHLGNPFLNIQFEAMLHRRLVYIYLLNVPSFSSRYFNIIKRTSRLGRLLALSLEILSEGALAIRRIFSLVDMITKPKFSNCPNIFKIGLFR